MNVDNVEATLGRKLHAGQRPPYERYGVVVVVALLLALPAFIEPAYLKFLPVLLGALVAGTSLIAGIIWLVTRGQSKLLSLHENGLLIRTPEGLRAVPWAEVKSVTQASRRVNGAQLEQYDVNFGDTVRISVPQLGADKAQSLLDCVTESAGLEWDESGRIAALR